MQKTIRQTIDVGMLEVTREDYYLNGKLVDTGIELAVSNNKVRFLLGNWPQVRDAVEKLARELDFSIDEGFGERLHQYRKDRHLTLTQLSELSRVSPAHIGRIERGDRFPGGRILARLEQALTKGG